MSRIWTRFGVLWLTTDGLLRYATARSEGTLDSLADVHDMQIRYWFSNMTPTGSLPVGPISHRVMIFPDGWIGDRLAHLLPPSTLQDGSDAAVGPDSRKLQSLSSFLTCVLQLAVMVSAVFLEVEKTRILRILAQSSTLADWLARILRSLGPQFPVLDEILAKAVDELSLNAAPDIPFLIGNRWSVPFLASLDYALELAGTAVPGPGGWNMLHGRAVRLIDRPGDLDGLKEQAAPTLLQGRFQPDQGRMNPIGMNPSSGHSGVFGRTCFTLGEVETLTRYGRFHVESVLLGPPFLSSQARTPLRECLKSLVACSGGQTRARECLAANLVAYNILAIILQRSRTDTMRPTGALLPGLDTAWLMAQHRLNLMSTLNGSPPRGGPADSSGGHMPASPAPDESGGKKRHSPDCHGSGLSVRKRDSGICQCMLTGNLLCRQPALRPTP
ncbi:MAG: hypothetical protein OXC91_10700 [Rhodobacteraceae bacterium]|nr:hypothetical protein [Paracoccaceae bacterium]